MFNDVTKLSSIRALIQERINARSSRRPTNDKKLYQAPKDKKNFSTPA